MYIQNNYAKLKQKTYVITSFKTFVKHINCYQIYNYQLQLIFYSNKQYLLKYIPNTFKI